MGRAESIILKQKIDYGVLFVSASATGMRRHKLLESVLMSLYAQFPVCFWKRIIRGVFRRRCHYELRLLKIGCNYCANNRTEWSCAHLKIHPILQVNPNRMRFLLVIAALLAHSWSSTAQLSPYVVDMDSSTFSFQVEHLGIATVDGVFTSGSGLIMYSPSIPDSIAAQMTLNVQSIDTDNQMRDRELRSEDFLDMGRYPVISFSSTGTMAGEDIIYPLLAEGDMTIYGVTRQLQLPLDVKEVEGTLTIRSIFSIRRKDFEIDFGILMNSLVSDEIKINVEMVAHRDK